MHLGLVAADRVGHLAQVNPVAQVADLIARLVPAAVGKVLSVLAKVTSVVIARHVLKDKADVGHHQR